MDQKAGVEVEPDGQNMNRYFLTSTIRETCAVDGPVERVGQAKTGGGGHHSGRESQDRKE